MDEAVGRRKMGQRRERILEAAERLLAHYGPNKTTVADIARAAKVGVGTVYLEFNSKDAIIARLSTARHQSVLDAMGAALDRPDIDDAQKIHAFYEARLQGFLRESQTGTHAHELVHCACPAVVSCHMDFHERAQTMLKAFLADAHDRGQLHAPDPERAALALDLIYRPFLPPWIFERSPETLARELDAVSTLITHGLRAPRQA